jgi:hypothetical protein
MNQYNLNRLPDTSDLRLGLLDDPSNGEETVESDDKTSHSGVRPMPEAQEGGTESQVGDRTGPAAGYDMEPRQVADRGGVS